MIGKWLETLTDEQTDRVLTTKMNSGSYRKVSKNIGPCLVGVAADTSKIDSVCIAKVKVKYVFPNNHTSH